MEGLGQEFANYIVVHNLIRPYYDLQPANFTLDSAALAYGQPTTLTLSSRVVNWGNSSTGPFAVGFWDGENLLHEFVVPTLGPRYEGEVMVSTSWSDPITRPHTFRVVVDSGQQVEEWKEDNNTATETVEIDIAIEELHSSVPLVQPGQTADITVTATVSNLGDVAVHQVAFQLRDGSSGDPIGTTTVAELMPGAGQEVSLIWPHQPAGSYPMVGIVDPEDVIFESDEGNNEAQGTVLVAAYRVILPYIMKSETI
jgi:subtilase family serine protease